MLSVRSTPVYTVCGPCSQLESTSNVYSVVHSPQDTHPGRLIHHLDFTHFRTIGMRRSLEEGVTGRFVTPERLLAILKVRGVISSAYFQAF